VGCRSGLDGVENRVPDLTGTQTRALGLAVAQALVADSPPRRPGFDPGLSHVRSVVDIAELGESFSEYFGFPCHHLSSKTGTIDQ
jgi:hypothetical protein